jgi:hypothetical protein
LWEPTARPIVWKAIGVVVMTIDVSLDRIIKALDIHSDCGDCGAVIGDPNLLKPDPLNPGKYQALCPSCKHECMRLPYTTQAVRPIFEMIVECAKLGGPILVLTLVCTLYEIMVDGFLYRLLERRYCDDSVCDGILNIMEHRHKLDMIEELTHKTIGELAKELKFTRFPNNFRQIKSKRNSFLHTGTSHKVVYKKFGKVKMPEYLPLDERDTKEALSFAEDIIYLFAKLYTKYGKWEPEPWADMYDDY